MKKQFFFGLLALAFCAWGSCKSDPATSGNETPAPPAETPAPAKPEYKLTPFTPSAAFADAAMKSMDYKGGKFSYKIGGSTYKLGEQTPDAPQKMCANSKEGQHIHLIVDTEPYVAKYTADFDHEVPDGEHYLLSFLSRSYHESIKTPAARMVKKVTVAGKSITKTADVKEPMLFYSRPKGIYTGKAETDKIMLDFYVVNAELGAGKYSVKVLVNGEKEFVADAWQPYYLEGLPIGDNKIKLTLVDKDGKDVVTPLNPVERVFTLKADPLEEK